MAAGTHPNIWRKRHVLAPWIIQIGVGLAALILSARALSIRVPDERSLTIATSQFNSSMTLSVAIIMIALTVTEIALCARKTLDPVTMLLLVTAKTGVMGMHMIQLVGMYAVKPTFDSLVWNFPVTVVLLGTMVAQLVVSRRVYGRGIQQQQQQGAGATSVSAIEDEEALKTDASPPKYTF